mmetsp:Transcript_18758/g.61256  ORF Transcript_18758/g.61256 Transcript_18758/m.61256 type:complete len:242 (-) Transcript_18758:671-1396(-)
MFRMSSAKYSSFHWSVRLGCLSCVTSVQTSMNCCSLIAFVSLRIAFCETKRKLRTPFSGGPRVCHWSCSVSWNAFLFNLTFFQLAGPWSTHSPIKIIAMRCSSGLLRSRRYTPSGWVSSNTSFLPRISTKEHPASRQRPMLPLSTPSTTSLPPSNPIGLSRRMSESSSPALSTSECASTMHDSSRMLLPERSIRLSARFSAKHEAMWLAPSPSAACARLSEMRPGLVRSPIASSCTPRAPT